MDMFYIFYNFNSAPLLLLPAGFISEYTRLRLNSFVLMLSVFASLVSFDSTVPTIHQYVTNPTEEEMNRTMTVTKQDSQVA